MEANLQNYAKQLGLPVSPKVETPKPMVATGGVGGQTPPPVVGGQTPPKNATNGTGTNSTVTNGTVTPPNDKTQQANITGNTSTNNATNTVTTDGTTGTSNNTSTGTPTIDFVQKIQEVLDKMNN